jgi:hypothetical protein
MTKKIISLFLVFSFVISVVGCTKYAKQEEIQQLKQFEGGS